MTNNNRLSKILTQADFFLVSPSNNIGVFAAQALDGCGPQLVSRPQTAVNKNVKSDLKQILIYPNPTKGVFTLSIFQPKSGSFNVEIFDITGNILRSFKAKNVSSLLRSNMKIDLSNLSNGLYTGRVTILNETRTFKIVKY